MRSDLNKAMTTLRVMIVEDNPNFLKTLRNFLHLIPSLTVVATAHEGREALPLLQATQPHVLILDIKMSPMTGWQVLDELQKVNTSAHIIMLSAHTDEYLEQDALDKGAEALVNKADPARLLDILQTIIHRYSDHRR